MSRSRYTLSFAAAVVLLTLAATATYREISARSMGADAADIRWPDDTLPAPVPAAKSEADYAAIVAADEAWRQRNAKAYSLNELRVRGDGKRTPRQAMQDRVFALTRAGDRAQAIVVLERWVSAHPRDGDALVWLARLLNEAGRSKESVKRYRQALEVEGTK